MSVPHALSGAALGATVASTLLSASSATLAAQDPEGAECAVLATPDDDARYPYRQYGTRCEGYFSRLLGAPPVLRVLSLTVGQADYDPRENPSVSIGWSPVVGGDVTVRVQSLVRTQQYLMSASVPADVGTLEWPQGVLARASALRGRDLAVLAWTERSVAGMVERVHVPVRVRVPGRLEPPSRFLLEILSDRRLERVSSMLTRVDQESGAEATVSEETDVGGAPYLPFTRIGVPVAGALSSGLYYLRVAGAYLPNRVGADSAGSADLERTAVEVWFFAPASPSN